MALLPLIADLPRPIGYVLAGGAAFGAVQEGQLKALATTDLRPDLVVGTSVGSLNGAVLAEDPGEAHERLIHLWQQTTRDAVFGSMLSNAMSFATGRLAMADHSGLTKIIENALASRTFADLAIPLTAMATDFDTGQAVSMTEGDLVPALLASAAIPLVFPPVERKGRTLVDGGLVANVPIGIAAAQGARTIVVLDCGFTVLPPRRDDTYGSMLMRTMAIMSAQQVRRDLEHVQDRFVLYLPGPWPIRSRPDDFRRSQSLAAQSYGLSQAWLKTLKVEGPGRYGLAPTDLLVKRTPAAQTVQAVADQDAEELLHAAQEPRAVADQVEPAALSVAEGDEQVETGSDEG